LMYPSDVEPATDPRMIQAITQTMIGEYLWKYTRKAGRSGTSSTRHRRFFWVHPYTRTLYWSEQDPSTAGKQQLKAKSVAIEAVRVITDDNSYPPGLYRKSLVVVTPGREIVFTAPTGQRHETWFNALSYLLLRTAPEAEGVLASTIEDPSQLNEDDIAEFNPQYGRSASRTGRSRVSLSSYNSQATRISSPSRPHAYQAPTLTRRQPMTLSQTPVLTPTTPATVRQTSPQRDAMTRSQQGSMSGRFSSLFKPSGSMRGSFSSKRSRASAMGVRGGDSSAIYDASVVNDSAEDLRAVIERQERDADRLENVRACCDGKHDVGSLSRDSRHGGRHHAHSHSHSQDTTGMLSSVSSRPR